MFAVEAGLTLQMPYGSCLDPELPTGEGEMVPLWQAHRASSLAHPRFRKAPTAQSLRTGQPTTFASIKHSVRQERGPFQFVNDGLMIEGPLTDFTCDQFLGDAHRAVDGGSCRNGDDGERLGY